MFRWLFVGVLAAAVNAPGSFAVGAEDDRFDLDAFWRSVVEVNRVWTDPATGPLSYTATSEPVGDTPVTTSVNRVWCSGRRARWEMDVFAKVDEPPRTRYALVIDGPVARYLEGPQKVSDTGRIASRDLRLLRQGVVCDTAMHVVCSKGLPGDARVIRRPPAGEAGLVVLEVDLGTNRRSIGLGILHSYKGQASGVLGRVRLTIRVPELTPAEEEYLESGDLLEYPEPFLAYGDRRAPAVARFVSTLQDDKTPWVLEQRFQKVGGHWLLDRAENIQGGETVVAMTVKAVGADPISSERFNLSRAGD